MARKFQDASRLLHDLLDRHEDGVASVRAYPDREGFGDIREADRFDREVSRAAEAGAVRLVSGSGRDRDRVARVELLDAALLYEYLKRPSAATKAQEAATEIFANLTIEPALRSVGQTAIETWSRNKQWSGLQPGDKVGLRNALMLAQALVQGMHRGLDYRTFSRRVTGNSKELERLEQAVVVLLSSTYERQPGSDARSFLSDLGLDRFGPPLLLRGPIALDGLPLPATLPFFGIPARAYARISVTRTPTYILSIENQTSFNRQVMEIDPDCRGIVLYTGGYPSLDIQRAIAYLASMLPRVPFFHWSDIDPDGTWIFRTVERAAGRKILPHLMSIELAETKGALMLGPASLRSHDVEGSGIADLVHYFEVPGARWLEQEELDPLMPLSEETLHG